jgi:hypothetical protein
MTPPAPITAGARGGTAAPPPQRWLALGLLLCLAQLMLIPVFAISAENMQQKTRMPGEIIAALALVANLGLTPRKKAVADLSALLRGPAQAGTLLTPGTDA